MPVYAEAPNEVRLIVEEMVEKYHQPLREHQVKIDLLFATAKADEFGEVSGAPVKLNGYPCAAIAKAISYKLRVQGHGDCEIIIDGDKWPEYSEEETRALIDHELEHFELKFDKDGYLVRDDLDRPKIKIRKHDHQFGWFNSVARRHGKASLEVKQAESFITGPLRQLWLPFLDGAFAGIKPASALPAQVRICNQRTVQIDNIAVTVDVGEEYDAYRSIHGEVFAKVGNHDVPLNPGDFDVIAWEEGEPVNVPKSAVAPPRERVVCEGPQHKFPLAKLFKGKLLESLSDAGLKTVGQLSARLEKDGLDGTPGIGPGGKEKIANTMRQFWIDNPVEEPELEDAAA
jgi:hypothetical protein